MLFRSPEQEVATVQRIFHLYAYEGHGYKRIAGILNEEGVPAPNKKGWSFSTIWSILHNQSYVGIRTWNKQSYDTPGTKYKPEDQWIKTEKAHPAIIAQEVFDLVKQKGEERNKVYPGFRAGQSPYILRGLLFCPRCGGKMVSGQSGNRSGSKQYVRKYYLCGNYQRKGKTVCEFRAFPKEEIEKAIVDGVTRELLILSIPGSLEEAIKAYRTASDGIHLPVLYRLEADIAAKEKYLALLNSDASFEFSTSVQRHIESLTEEISQLKANLAAHNKDSSADFSENEMNILRQQMRNHSEQLTWGGPDMKCGLLRSYVARIDLSGQENTLKVSFQLLCPGSEIKVLEKTIVLSYL